MGLGIKKQDSSRAAYLAHRYAIIANQSGALVKLHPGHQRQDLLTAKSFNAAYRCLVYGAGKGCFGAN